MKWLFFPHDIRRYHEMEREQRASKMYKLLPSLYTAWSYRNSLAFCNCALAFHFRLNQQVAEDPRSVTPPAVMMMRIVYSIHGMSRSWKAQPGIRLNWIGSSHL